MAKIETLDEIFSGIPSFMRNINLGTSGWNFIMPNILGTYTQPQLPPEPGNHRVKKSSFGYELGYLVAMDFFPADKFNDGQLAVIDWSDDVNKKFHIGKSRKQGGPYDAHTTDMNREYVRLSDKMSIPYDWRLPVAISLHDGLEDHPDILELADILKDITSKAKAANLRRETFGSRQLRAEIRQKREDIGVQLMNELNEVVDSLPHQDDANSGGKDALKLGGAFALGIDDWMTRHTEERFFFQSMYPFHILHPLHYYSDSRAIFPFQNRVMEILGIRSGMEPLEYFQARVAGKGLDRIVLSREIKPRFPARKQVRELEAILAQDPVLIDRSGNPKRVSEIYGHVEFKAEDMPRPYRLNILFRNFVVLQNIHYALNRHGTQIVQQSRQNQSAYNYLQLTLAIREALLSETGNVIQELKGSYERDLGRKQVAAEKEAIAMNLRDYPRFFEVITGEGAISRGARLDTVYRGRWGKLDERKMRENYRNVLEYEVLLQNFSDPRRNISDSDPGFRKPFSMFTLRGLTDRLRPVEFNPSFYGA